MEVQASSNIITIVGNIKNINDFAKIKSLADNIILQHKSITLNIVDSLSITSSVIGYFNKLVVKDKIEVQINVGSDQLINLLNDLNLATTFNAKKSL